MGTSSVLELQREQQEFTFDGNATAEIRTGLVLGLYAAAEVARVREISRYDTELGEPWEQGYTPRMPVDNTIWKIANALLWLETTSPSIAAPAAGGDL